MRIPAFGGRRLLFAVGFAWCMASSLAVDAMTANPNPFKDVQPDGTPVTLYIHGDEFGHWYSDLAGYTVLKSGSWYVYAQPDGTGELAATAYRVGRDSPKSIGVERGLMPSTDKLARARDAARGSLGAEIVQPIAPAGSVKNIVILLQFINHFVRPLPTNANFNTLFNAVNGDPTFAPTGSVADVYFENSYGSFVLDSDVFGWVVMPNTEQYYADGVSGLSTPKRAEMITTALTLADAFIDFSQYDQDNDGFVDAITFVHSGYAAEFGGTDSDGTPSSNRIWSHKGGIPTWTSAEGVKVSPYNINPGLWGTSGTAIGRIGVICHEVGHFFGLPDLYDTSKPGEGIGSWGLMANSWGFGGNQYNPPHFSAWSKIQLGWVTPTVISGSGSYSVPQAETNPVAYKITQGFPSGEYLLIENRQPVGIESTMPQGGLAIFHIDENADFSTQGYPGQSGWPANGLHYRVALLQADGQYHLERGGFGRGDSGDMYRAGFASELTSTTLPNTNAYQGGVILDSGVSITGISASGPNMSFWLGGPPTDVVYVDFAHFGSEIGAINLPWNTLTEALAAVDSNGEIRIKGDTADSESSEAMTISQPVMIDSLNGSVTIGVPGVSSGQYASTDVPKAIPDTATVSSNLIVGDSYEIADINVTVNIAHTFDGDLQIELIAPDLTSVMLANQRGGSGQNFTNTTFDDEAGTLISAGTAPFTGSYRPDGTLTALDSKGAQGTWTLRITDNASLDVGTLFSWSISINGG